MGPSWGLWFIFRKTFDSQGFVGLAFLPAAGLLLVSSMLKLFYRTRPQAKFFIPTPSPIHLTEGRKKFTKENQKWHSSEIQMEPLA